MTVDVKPSVLVHRSPAEVAAFMFNPANDLRWTGGITSSTPAQPGPLVEGATVVRTARFLGRSFTYGYVVTRHEPDRLVELRVDRPFPMTVRRAWDCRISSSAIGSRTSPSRLCTDNMYRLIATPPRGSAGTSPHPHPTTNSPHQNRHPSPEKSQPATHARPMW